MRLTQNNIHLSIIDFPEVVLPKFTLLTGVNGVGKMIEARKKGHSVTEQQLSDGSVKVTINIGGLS